MLMQAFDIAMRASTTTTASDDAAGAIGLLFVGVIYCCIPLVFLGVWGAVTYWVYNDAKKSNVENPPLWALVTFFGGIIGLIIYVAVGKNQNK